MAKLYAPEANGARRLREAACWAHLRRDFHDFWTSTKSESAREALDRIGKLYDIERDINGQPADARHAARQKLSQPKVEAFFAWSEQQQLRIPGKSDLAKAFRYGLSRQPITVSLSRCCQQGSNKRTKLALCALGAGHQSKGCNSLAKHFHLAI